MDKLKATPDYRDYTENTTVQPDNAGGWLAVNTGTGNVSVDGFVLEPGDGLDFLDLYPGVVWNKQIQIVIMETGGKVRLCRLYYSEIRN